MLIVLLNNTLLQSHLLILCHTKQVYYTLFKEKSLLSNRELMKMTLVNVTFKNVNIAESKALGKRICIIKEKYLTESYIMLKFQVQHTW